MDTFVEIGEFKGRKMFSIMERDEDGQTKEYPLVSFGIRKAKAIIKHIEDIEAYVEEVEDGQ